MPVKNESTFWNPSEIGSGITCKLCGLPFTTFEDLEHHLNEYCNSGENLQILKKHFNSLGQRMQMNNCESSNASKIVILMKGLIQIKQEWDETRINLKKMFDPHNHFAKQESQLNFGAGSDLNAKKKRYRPLFDPSNPQIFLEPKEGELENLKNFPMLTASLREKGQDLLKLGVGDTLGAEGKKIYPEWFHGYKDEARKENLQDVDNPDLVYGFEEDGQRDITMNSLRRDKEALFNDPKQLEYYEAQKADAGIDISMKAIQMYLRKPPLDFDNKFFDKNKREPTLKEIEQQLVELELKQDRHNKYTSLLNNLFAIHEGMSETLLTPLDSDKREELQKLIGQREILYQREVAFYPEQEQVKEAFFSCREYDYYAMEHPDNRKLVFIRLYEQSNWKKVIFDSEHLKIQQDLCRLNLGHFQPRKNQSSLMLSAQNALNPNLSDKFVDKQHPTLNRPRNLVVNNMNSSKINWFVNILRDIEGLKKNYKFLGEDASGFNFAIDNVEKCMLQRHKHLLREDITKLVRDPEFANWASWLLKKFQDFKVLDDHEISYFKTELNINSLEDDMKQQMSHNKFMDMYTKRYNAISGHKVAGGDFAIGDNSYQYDPVQSLISLKTDDNHLKQVEELKKDPFAFDSLTMLQKKQDLLMSIQKIKHAKVQTEEEKFRLANLEKFEKLHTDMEELAKQEKELVPVRLPGMQRGGRGVGSRPTLADKLKGKGEKSKSPAPKGKKKIVKKPAKKSTKKASKSPVKKGKTTSKASSKKSVSKSPPKKGNLKSPAPKKAAKKTVSIDKQASKSPPKKATKTKKKK